METKLEKEVRFLKAYAVIATLICGLLLLTAFTLQNRKQKFVEIDVERINVVEKDGALRLVISNKERSPGPIQRGKSFGYAGGDRPGMIFFNDEGTEAGGLTVGGKRENGDVRASASLTFDQYEQDQTIALQYVDRGGTRRAGLAILDLPTDISSMEKEEVAHSCLKRSDNRCATAAAMDMIYKINKSQKRLNSARIFQIM